MGIGVMLRRALAKLVMRAAGDHVNTVYGNLQLCAGLEAYIDGGNNDIGQRKRDISDRKREKESGNEAEDEEEKETNEGGLTVDTLGID